jgi:hypothetical protein
MIATVLGIVFLLSIALNIVFMVIVARGVRRGRLLP